MYSLNNIFIYPFLIFQLFLIVSRRCAKFLLIFLLNSEFIFNNLYPLFFSFFNDNIFVNIIILAAHIKSKNIKNKIEQPHDHKTNGINASSDSLHISFSTSCSCSWQKPNNYVFSWKIVWSPIHLTFQIVVMPHGSLWLNIIVI